MGDQLLGAVIMKSTIFISLLQGGFELIYVDQNLINWKQEASATCKLLPTAPERPCLVSSDR